MRTILIISVLVFSCVLGLGLVGSEVTADDSGTSVQTKLTGFEEVPPKLTAGHGNFEAVIDSTSITYTLTFSDLSSAATASHIHFGQPGVNGGIFAFLCGGGGKPACPASGGTVKGTIIAADILAPSPDQGIAAGDFAGAVTVILSGTAYVNVHSTRFPAGEIRGQLESGQNEQGQNEQ